MEKIIKKSLADEVAAAIAAKIKEGRLAKNAQLPTEVELASSYGVGRSTIREAIKILVHAGLLRVQHGVGMFVEDKPGMKEPFVQRVKRAKAEELNEVRKLLEVKIAELAAMHHRDEDLEEIRYWLHERSIASLNGELEDCIEADVNFHLAIARASGNSLMEELYQTVAESLKSWFRHIYEDTTSFTDTGKLHEDLLLHIKDKDPVAALKAAEAIINF